MICLPTLLHPPERIACHKCYKDRTPIRKNRDEFIQMLKLQGIVECELETMCPVKKRSGYENKEKNAAQRVLHKSQQLFIRWRLDPFQRDSQTIQEK